MLDSKIEEVCLDLLEKKKINNKKIVKEQDKEIEKIMCQNKLILLSLEQCKRNKEEI